MAELDEEIGQLNDGGTIQVTDFIPVERGDGNAYVTIGSAGTKRASNLDAEALASVNGTITPGHLAVFADVEGSLEDGGPIPLGIETLLGAPILDSVSLSDYIPVIRGGTLYRALVSSVLAATAPADVYTDASGNPYTDASGNPYTS